MIESKQEAMPPEVKKRIGESGIIAVLEIEKLEHAMPVAGALLKGGVSAIELTLRTPVAFDAAKAIISAYPDMLVGMGTVLTEKQVESAAEIGAAFAVAPGCNPRVIKAAMEAALPFTPGVATPSEIETAIELGCRVLKYFPAETCGGLKHLKSMAGPYSYLDLKYIPLGGLNSANAGAYLTSPLVLALGGSWLAKREVIKAEEWELITQNSLEIRKIINQKRDQEK